MDEVPIVANTDQVPVRKRLRVFGVKQDVLHFIEATF